MKDGLCIKCKHYTKEENQIPCVVCFDAYHGEQMRTQYEPRHNRFIKLKKSRW
jgi:hypothetical protein